MYLCCFSRFTFPSPSYLVVDRDDDIMMCLLSPVVVILLIVVLYIQVEELAQKLPGLTALNLDRCNVGDTGVRALSSLTKLEVSGAVPQMPSSFPLGPSELRPQN